MLFLVLGAHLAADRPALAERQVFMDSEQIEPVDDRQHLLDHPANIAVFVFFELGQKIDQLANEPKRARDIFAGIVQGDLLGARIQPRQKEPVGQHLCKGVGEFPQRQLVKNLVAKDLKEPEEPAFPVIAFLPDQLLAEIVAQQPAARGESQCQLLRPPDPLRRGGEETLQQLCDGGNAILARPKPRIFEIGRVAQHLALGPVLADPDEMQIVRDNNVLRQTFVASDLLRFQNRIEIFADCLVLDISENAAALGDLEIGCALSGDALWLMLDDDTVGRRIRHRFQQGLQRRAVGVLRLLVEGRLAEIEQVAFKNIAGRHLALCWVVSSMPHVAPGRPNGVLLRHVQGTSEVQ